MQDLPRPETLVAAVAAFLRAEIAPQIKGAANFQLRVAVNGRAPTSIMGAYRGRSGKSCSGK